MQVSILMALIGLIPLGGNGILIFPGGKSAAQIYPVRGDQKRSVSTEKDPGRSFERTQDPLQNDPGICCGKPWGKQTGRFQMGKRYF